MTASTAPLLSPAWTVLLVVSFVVLTAAIVAVGFLLVKALLRHAHKYRKGILRNGRKPDAAMPRER